MEAVLALAIGIVFGSGIWLLLRPRSFQVLTGLMLMSYAVNLFIFVMGRVWLDEPPLTPAGSTPSTAPTWPANPPGAAGCAPTTRRPRPSLATRPRRSRPRWSCPSSRRCCGSPGCAATTR